MNLLTICVYTQTIFGILSFEDKVELNEIAKSFDVDSMKFDEMPYIFFEDLWDLRNKINQFCIFKNIKLNDGSSDLEEQVYNKCKKEIDTIATTFYNFLISSHDSPILRDDTLHDIEIYILSIKKILLYFHFKHSHIYDQSTSIRINGSLHTKKMILFSEMFKMYVWYGCNLEGIREHYKYVCSMEMTQETYIKDKHDMDFTALCALIHINYYAFKLFWDEYF